MHLSASEQRARCRLPGHLAACNKQGTFYAKSQITSNRLIEVRGIWRPAESRVLIFVVEIRAAILQSGRNLVKHDPDENLK